MGTPFQVVSLAPGGGGTTTATTSVDLPAGSLAVVFTWGWSTFGADATATVSDGTANVYAKAVSSSDSSGFNCAIYYCSNTAHDVPAGSTISVSGINQSVGFSMAGVAGYNGGIDAAVTGNGSGASGSLSTGTLATASEVVFSAWEANANPATFSEGSGFSSIGGDATTWGVAAAYSAVSSTASVTYGPSWTGASTEFEICLASFEATGGGGSTTTLAAAEGSFSETGEGATFETVLAPANGTFAETGEAASFAVKAPEAAGSFVEAGEAATFIVDLNAAFGSFIETGEAAGPAASASIAGVLGGASLAHFALAQVVDQASATTVLVAGGTSLALAGEAVTFKVSEAAAQASFVLTGEGEANQVDEPVSAGSFTLTGEAVTFRAALSGAAGAFAFTGEAAVLKTVLAAGSGSFAESGEAATFRDELAAAAGSFALGGRAAAFDPAEVAGCGAFALSGEATLYSYDLLGGGGTIVAGTFSRRQWHALQETLAAEAAARQAAYALRRQELRDAAQRRDQARRDALAAAWVREDAARVQALSQRELTDATAAFAVAQQLAAALHRQHLLHAAATAARSQAAQQDEDDAIALLLAA